MERIAYEAPCIVEWGIIPIVEWGIISIVEQGVIHIVERGVISIVEWGVMSRYGFPREIRVRIRRKVVEDVSENQISNSERVL